MLWFALSDKSLSGSVLNWKGILFLLLKNGGRQRGVFFKGSVYLLLCVHEKDKSIMFRVVANPIIGFFPATYMLSLMGKLEEWYTAIISGLESIRQEDHMSLKPAWVTK